MLFTFQFTESITESACNNITDYQSGCLLFCVSSCLPSHCLVHRNFNLSTCTAPLLTIRSFRQCPLRRLLRLGTRSKSILIMQAHRSHNLSGFKNTLTTVRIQPQIILFNRTVSPVDVTVNYFNCIKQLKQFKKLMLMLKR